MSRYRALRRGEKPEDTIVRRKTWIDTRCRWRPRKIHFGGKRHHRTYAATSDGYYITKCSCGWFRWIELRSKP